ncbi:MAG TPA: hypothetical protein VFT39_15805 [Vicinamibacterales bacterium]|nr:hypothetical protein [Vicinamibacterales bacterium]
MRQAVPFGMPSIGSEYTCSFISKRHYQDRGGPVIMIIVRQVFRVLAATALAATAVVAAGCGTEEENTAVSKSPSSTAAAPPGIDRSRPAVI